MKIENYSDFFNYLNTNKNLYLEVTNLSNKWCIVFKSIKCTVVLNYNNNSVYIFKKNLFKNKTIFYSDSNKEIFKMIIDYINDYIIYNNKILINNITKLTSTSKTKDRINKINNLIS